MPQSTTPPPGRVARADDEVGACRRRSVRRGSGSAAGSWLKSASIWTTIVGAALERDARTRRGRRARGPAWLADAGRGSRGSAAARSSASWPVPSGEPSSTTSRVAAGQGREDRRGDRADVLGLVVGRQDDPDAGAERRRARRDRRARPGVGSVMAGKCRGRSGSMGLDRHGPREAGRAEPARGASTTTGRCPGLTYVPGGRLAAPGPAIRAGLDGAVGPDRPHERAALVDRPPSTVAARRKVSVSRLGLAGRADRTTIGPAQRPRSCRSTRIGRARRRQVAGPVATLDPERVAAVGDDRAGAGRGPFQVDLPARRRR